MDRPVSAASSNTTPSVSSYPNATGLAQTNGHRRTKSTPRAATWASLITLYITNLRLLNLDLLPDWPDITATTFSNVDARARIKASEWSLYQLFRLYDPALTSDRLQPFFPPLEPLQSINLRAALYRCLDGLKKNGVLGRETVLRKTMLDECSGDKFWEVCMVLSALVLRKVILEKKSKGGVRPVAQRLGTAQGLGKRERDMLVPMAMAHKAALAKVLQEKQAVRERLAKLDAILEDKDSDLAKRKAELHERARGGRSQKQTDTLDVVSQHIRKGWTGDDALRDAIISGENGSSRDRALLGSTADFVSHAGESSVDGHAVAEAGALENIEQRARSQNLRLRRWQAMYDKLQASRPQNGAANGETATSGSHDLQFNKHSDLTLDTVRAQRPTQLPPTPAKSSFATRYDDILTSLREDLRQAQGHRRTATMPVQYARKPSITLDAVAGAQSSAAHQRQHSRSPSSAQRSPGPFRPGLGRRVSSRSKSYQQPKVISQREPIPLKSEIFSPLKTTRRGSGSSASTSRPTSLLPSPREEEAPVSASIDDALSALSSKRGSVTSEVDTAPKIDSAVSFGLGIDPSSPQDATIQHDALEFKKPSLPPPSQARQAPRPSLAERTRMSMAFTSNEDTRKVTRPPSPVSAPPVPQASEKPEEITPSLADRTRQSISHFPRLPSTTSALERKPSTKPSHARTRSSIVTSSYPVNQFDTPPRKVRRSSFGAGDQLVVEEEPQNSAARRDITPRDKLFEADAEYDSVFKARPKIAVSPVLSPSVREDEEMEVARLGDSSPLGGR